MAANSETDAPDLLDWPAEAARHGRNDSFREGKFRALVTGGLVRVRCGPATEFCLRAPGLPVASEGASCTLKSVAIALGRGISVGVDLGVVPPAHLAGWLEALAALAHNVPAAATGRDRAQVVGSLPACYPGLERCLGPRPDEPCNFGIAVTCSRRALARPAQLQQRLLQASYLCVRRYPVNCGPAARLLSAGVSSACLPQSHFCVAAGQAWLVLELNLARLADAAGMRWQIRDCVNFADALTTSSSWGVPALITDALLNRRVAWVLTGIAQKVIQEGSDPDDFATLCGLRRWLYAVRRCIVYESARIGRENFSVRVRRPANRWTRAAADLCRVVAGEHILVASPDALLPDAESAGQHVDGAWLKLFPALACTDALAAPGRLARRLSYANWCRMVSLSRSFASG